MVLRFARFVLVLAFATVVAYYWWFWPGADVARLIAQDELDLYSGPGDGLETFTTQDQLRAARPDRSELAQDVDWSREKVVRVSLPAAGYLTEEKVDGKVQLSEVQFGKLATTSRFGGRSVRFYLYESTPYLICGTVHSVFCQQQQIAWYAVPQAAEVRLVSDPSDLATDGLFVFSVITAWAAAFAVRRRWRLARSRQRIVESTMQPEDKATEDFDQGSGTSDSAAKPDEAAVVA